MSPISTLAVIHAVEQPLALLQRYRPVLINHSELHFYPPPPLFFFCFLSNGKDGQWRRFDQIMVTYGNRRRPCNP